MALSGRAVAEEFCALFYPGSCTDSGAAHGGGTPCARASSVANCCNVSAPHRPNTLILGFIRPICVDNGTTEIENQCARSDGESVSGYRIRERA
jgi:hypothetical protein